MARHRSFQCLGAFLFVLLALASAPAGESARLREWREAAANGDHVAMTDIGAAYANASEGLDEDYREAARWFRKAAAAGNKFAANNLGIFHTNGLGVEKDDAVALEWYEKAGELGLAKAQWSAGKSYRNGTGTAQNFEKARHWYSLAAEQDYAPAFVELAMVFYIMYMEEEDPSLLARSVHWMERAAVAGDPDAQFNMGVFFNNGEGVPEDKRKAARWHEKAARNGVPLSQYNLGVYYMDGVGREQDFSQAKRWLTLAQENGVDKAAAKLAQLPEGVREGKDEAVRVGLTRLLDDYADNPRQADARYLDKLLEVVSDQEGGRVNVGGGSIAITPSGFSLTFKCVLAPAPGGRTVNTGPGVIHRGFCRGLDGEEVLLEDAVTLPAEETGGGAPETGRDDRPGRGGTAEKEGRLPTSQLPPVAKRTARTVPRPAPPTSGGEDRATLTGAWTGSITTDEEGVKGAIHVELQGEGEGYSGSLLLDNSLPGAVTSGSLRDGAGRIAANIVADGERYEAVLEGTVSGDAWAGRLELRDADGDPILAGVFEMRRMASRTGPVSRPVQPQPPETPPSKPRRGGLSGAAGKAGSKADPLAGTWEGTYVDRVDGGEYRLRLDRDRGLELLDEDLRAAVSGFSLDGGVAAARAAWASDDGETRYEAVFTGELKGGDWTGEVTLTANGEILFEGTFRMKKQG